jgi:hypothetical protein
LADIFEEKNAPPNLVTLRTAHSAGQTKKLAFLKLKENLFYFKK